MWYQQFLSNTNNFYTDTSDLCRGIWKILTFWVGVVTQGLFILLRVPKLKPHNLMLFSFILTIHL